MSKLKGFIGPTYQLRTVNYEGQKTINMYPEMDEVSALGMPTSKEQEVAMLVSVPGEDIVANLPKSPIRGLHLTAFGSVICVAGNSVYSLNTPDKGITWTTPNVIADLTTTTGPVCIADGIPNYYNGVLNSGSISQVVVVDGSNYGVVFEEGTTSAIQLNSSNAYNGANYVTFQDGYFVFTQNVISPTVFFAADPLNISDLDEVTANLGPDYVSRVISDHDILWFFGGHSSSVWQNTGGALGSNQFQQIPGSYAEGGCNLPWTIQKVSGQLIWVSNDSRGFGQVFLAAGYRGVRVSNHSVENWIQSFPDLTGISTWTYQDGGHSFYCINIPTSTTTWCYDLTTKMWSERAYFKNGTFSRDLIEHHIALSAPYYVASHLCSDYNSTKLYTLSNNSYLFGTEPIYRMRTAPHMSAGLDRVFYSQFQVDLESGIGLDGYGYAYPTGLNPVGYSATANAVPLNGNGVGGVYNFVDSNGNPALPTGTVSITPLPSSGVWSNSFTNHGDGTVTLNTSTFTITNTPFATGTGGISNFTFSGIASGTTINSANIYATDWRGTNLQSTTPITNLCTDSQNFADVSTWTLSGVTLAPSAWSTYPAMVSSAYRPSASVWVAGFGALATETTPSHAYSNTFGTLQVGGTLANAASITTTTTPGSTTYTSTLTYTTFGTGVNLSGTLNMSCLSTTISPSNMVISYSLDAGTTWVPVFTTTTSTMPSEVVSGSDFLPGSPLQVSGLTIPDMSLFQVQVNITTSNSMVFGASNSIYIWDILFLSAVEVPGSTAQNAPDGSNAGTYLIEDTTFNQHGALCSYNTNSGATTTISCYYQIGDSSRELELLLTGQKLTFSGSISGHTLTVLTPPSTGSLAIGMSVDGKGILPGTLISGGSGTVWTLNQYIGESSYSTAVIAPEPMVAYQILNSASFKSDGTHVGGTMTPVGTQFIGSVHTNQLTVISSYSGSLAIGQTISGTGITSGTTIIAGVASPYTLSNTMADTGPQLITASSSGTGIYRCSVSGVEVETGTHYAGALLYNPATWPYDKYVGNGASRLGIWGFQVQNGTETIYIPSSGGVSGTDYITVDLTGGTCVFNIPPYQGSILSWSGSVTGVSVYPLVFIATFPYTAYPNTTTSIGTDPQVRLSYSDDGGHTFSPEQSVSMGKIGNYMTRCIWRRLGMSRDRVFRLSCSDPVKFNIIGAEIKAKGADING